MRTISFQFDVQVPSEAQTSEHFVAEAKRLKRHLRELLSEDIEFGAISGNLAAVIKPSDIDREWGAVDRWVIDDL